MCGASKVSSSQHSNRLFCESGTLFVCLSANACVCVCASVTIYAFAHGFSHVPWSLSLALAAAATFSQLAHATGTCVVGGCGIQYGVIGVSEASM